MHDKDCPKCLITYIAEYFSLFISMCISLLNWGYVSRIFHRGQGSKIEAESRERGGVLGERSKPHPHQIDDLGSASCELP